MISPLGRASREAGPGEAGPEGLSGALPPLAPDSEARAFSPTDPEAAAAGEKRKAVLVRLDDLEQGIETLEVKWSPSSYRLSRTSRVDGAEPRAANGFSRHPDDGQGSRDSLSTELFLDTTQEEPGSRDARRAALMLRRWMEPLPGRLVPPRILFWWGPLRFAGFIEEVEEEWIRFDPDGTPVRGRLRLSLRS